MAADASNEFDWGGATQGAQDRLVYEATSII